MELATEQIAQYREEGYTVVKGLFDREAIPGMIDHYMAMRAEGAKPGDTGGTDDRPDDPNHQYPRMINMHNWDPASSKWAQRADILAMVRSLIRDEPVLQQTMLYFKPPGGRGQALHQDQQYITTEPLIGLWVALDPSDRDVGCMTVMPRSHKLGLLEVEKADTQISFTGGQTVKPAQCREVGVDMAPGDGLFFAGKTVHGSYPNTTQDRWRRSFIIHCYWAPRRTVRAASGPARIARALKSADDKAIAAHAGDGIDNHPNAGRAEGTQGQAEEKRPQTAVDFSAAVFEDNGFQEPGDKDRKPDPVNGGGQPQGQPHRVDRKANKAGLDISEDTHQGGANAGKSQMPGMDVFGGIDILGDPIAGERG
ncbi:MAG: hypothetical protein GKR89_10170 [Candidatus Latescibacteria bacterium]|nr:hypothetical protein [Candidatus Latescibacterota bacterium]